MVDVATRPKPTKNIILEVTGQNQGLISSLHHGLAETRCLKDIYSNLNFIELVAFAASSWKAREKRDPDFSIALHSGDIYDVFNQVNKAGFSWVNKNSCITPSAKYDAMNPYQGNTLKDRLSTVDVIVSNNLVNKLAEPVSEWVFEINYQQRKAARGGDNHRLEVMSFQNVYPKKGRIVPAFAAEVNRILADYPVDYSLW